MASPRLGRRLRTLGLSAGSKVVTIGAVPDVELVAHDREPHRMGAVEDLSVFDGHEPKIGGNIGSPAAVPTGPVLNFRLVHFACCGTYPGGSAAASPKK